MTSPKISIGMPVYNGAHFITQALNSLLSQTYQNFELIISDNGSTDDTKEICLNFAARDSRVRFSQNDSNVGAIKNFIRVLDLASADYFMWAAHDDIWEPKYIESLLSVMENDPEVIIAFSLFDAIDELNHTLVSYPTILELPNDDLYLRLANYIKQHESLGKANPFYSLMRKESLKQALANTLSLLQKNVWASDMLFVFSMLGLGKFRVVPENLFHKRIIVNSSAANFPEDWESYFDGYEYLIIRHEVLNDMQKKQLLHDVFIRRMEQRLSQTVRVFNQVKAGSMKKIKSLVQAWL